METKITLIFAKSMSLVSSKGLILESVSYILLKNMKDSIPDFLVSEPICSIVQHDDSAKGVIIFHTLTEP